MDMSDNKTSNNKGVRFIFVIIDNFSEKILMYSSEKQKFSINNR